MRTAMLLTAMLAFAYVAYVIDKHRGRQNEKKPRPSTPAGREPMEGRGERGPQG